MFTLKLFESLLNRLGELYRCQVRLPFYGPNSTGLNLYANLCATVLRLVNASVKLGTLLQFQFQ